MQRRFSEAARELAARKGVCAILAAYALFLLFSALFFGISGQLRNALLSAAYLAIIPLFLLAERGLGLRFGPLFAALLFFLAAGGILGSSYDLYTRIPCFDDILHGLSGGIFACVGFGLAAKVCRKETERRSFFVCLAAGIVFSLAVACLWELFEYAAYAFFGIDMQEDTLIDGFSSYYLSGTHNTPALIRDIEQTIIRYGGGRTLVLDGYLDIGLIDTLHDTAACFLGAAVWFLALTADRAFRGPLRRMLLPALLRLPQKNPKTPADPKK